MNSYLENLKKIIKTDTFKDTGIVLSGQILSTLFSVIFFFLIARSLGPAKLGIYTTVGAVVMILTDTIDIAINSTIIKFISSPEKDSFLKFSFIIKIFFGLVFMIMLFLFADLLSLVLKQDMSIPLKVSSLLVFVTFIFRFPKAIFQGEKKFFKDAMIDIGASFTRLIIILILIFINKLTIVNVLWANTLSAILVFLIWMKKTPLLFLKASISQDVKKRFLSFHNWLSFGFILAAIHSRLDSFFLMRFAGPAMVGYYQAGYRFFMPVNQFTSALSAVFAPRFASFKSSKETKNYLKKAATLSLFLSSILFVFIFFVPLAVKLIYGQSYQQSILPTQLLIPGFVAFIIGSPFISYILYHKGKSDFFAFLNLVQIFLIIILDIYFIPRYQAIGAAIALSVTLVIIYFIAIFQVLKK